MNQHNPATAHIDEVLALWFGPLQGGFAAAEIRKRWFASDPAFDRMIAVQFGNRLAAAAAGALNGWLGTARGRLAFIIVTDQFSRQIHRGSPRAFATDATALAAARGGIELGHDRQLGFDERTFFYLPFEHSESMHDQDTSVALFEALQGATPEPQRALTTDNLRFAQQHRDIVLRFGRFPHRNDTLGRISTAQEREFLRSASHFGQ